MNIRRCLNGHFYDADQLRVCPVCGARYSEPANADRPARPVAEPPAAAPETIDGRYEVLREIGRGGMSVVYLVSDRRGKKPLALKKIRCFSSENAGIVYESILMESALMQRISSPYFPAIHDIVHNENEIYIVMDYVEGVTLQRMVEQVGQLEPSAALHIATELCKALQYLHTLTPPIIVRDVKPSNIMIQPDKGVKLIDFGIAKELKTGASSDTTALGTRGYASPEHFGGLTDQRSDIYSFGETIRFALTGRDPNKTAFEAEPLDLQDDPLAVGFDYIIEKCTRVDPDDRYQNCGELLYDLEHIDKLSKRRVRKRKRLFGSRKKPSENAALAPDMDIVIKAAAVADYRPATVADNKLKKSDDALFLPLERTKDILGTLGTQKKEGQFLCGFSMETEHMLENSRAKLHKKNLDMIAANNVKQEGAGFQVDTNVLTLITADSETSLPLMSKDAAADALLDAILKRMK